MNREFGAVLVCVDDGLQSLRGDFQFKSSWAWPQAVYKNHCYAQHIDGYRVDAVDTLTEKFWWTSFDL